MFSQCALSQYEPSQAMKRLMKDIEYTIKYAGYIAPVAFVFGIFSSVFDLSSVIVTSYNLSNTDFEALAQTVSKLDQMNFELIYKKVEEFKLYRRGNAQDKNYINCLYDLLTKYNRSR